MLYIKMMTDTRFQSDDHPSKNYIIYQVKDTDEISFDFVEGDNEMAPHLPALFIRKADGTALVKALTGNVYIMNEAGKTIASHGC